MVGKYKNISSQRIYTTGISATLVESFIFPIPNFIYPFMLSRPPSRTHAHKHTYCACFSSAACLNPHKCTESLVAMGNLPGTNALAFPILQCRGKKKIGKLHLLPAPFPTLNPAAPFTSSLPTPHLSEGSHSPKSLIALTHTSFWRNKWGIYILTHRLALLQPELPD